ncbi:MAG TPA: hypothetical protein PLK90_09365 [Clostridiales bacterium]|jgi:hypothetical protein|nr:hypothetical protein [Clostridiales bacterium]HQP70595.1 hypothetical protein [Clostridiales bacterium]
MLTFKKKAENGKIEPKLDLSVEKLALSNMITLEALIQTLLKKNIINQEELLEEVKKMRKSTTVLKDEVRDASDIEKK